MSYAFFISFLFPLIFSTSTLTGAVFCSVYLMNYSSLGKTKSTIQYHHIHWGRYVTEYITSQHLLPKSFMINRFNDSIIV